MTTTTIDARDAGLLIEAALPSLGGRSPSGDVIDFTNAFMTWNGKPWLGVAGEFHYARYPREAWRDELAKMKACGIDIVSTYVFWIHHEEERGAFDWSGNRDLRSFIQLCGELGLFAIVRVGPFCHGEVRNGGIPDWLYGSPFPIRSNDARYLALVRALYREIGRQLDGLFFGQAGPIIAIQLENELMHAGAPWETTPRLCMEWVTVGSGGADHLRALKCIALEAGMEAPIHTATAWGGAPVLEGEVLPLYGGYAFWPWNMTDATSVHAPTREYVFRNYRRRGRGNGGFDPPYDPGAYPFACCEMGGGMQTWYRYRFVVPAQSVEAMALVKLAGGCSLLGYYMFHGGSNPVGRRGFLNEHVVPRISYDFQAPLGEYGQVRDSYRRLKRLHLFCRDFASELATTGTALPDGAEDVDPSDTRTLRWAARAAGDRGFLFFNNFQDHAESEDHADVAVDVQLPSGTVRIPCAGGFTLKRWVCAIMAFNLDLGSVVMRYATAQPLARLDVDGAAHLFFFSHDGIPAEYCFASADAGKIGMAGCVTIARGDLICVSPDVGLSGAITIEAPAGSFTIIHTLTAEQSLGAYKLHVWGRDRLVVTQSEVFEDRGSLRVRRRASEDSPLEVFAFPAVEAPLAAAGRRLEQSAEGGFSRIVVELPSRLVELQISRPNQADAEITLPPGAFDGLHELLLSIEYDGDVGSAFIDGRLVADDFSNGEPWEIGLVRFRSSLEKNALCLHIVPRREGSIVTVESGMAAAHVLHGREVASIRSITAIPCLETLVTSAPADPSLR